MSRQREEIYFRGDLMLFLSTRVRSSLGTYVKKKTEIE